MLSDAKVRKRATLRPHEDKEYIQRTMIKTIYDEQKNMAQIEHSKHRPISGFTANQMAGLATYSFFPKKPMIDLERVLPYESGHIQLSLL